MHLSIPAKSIKGEPASVHLSYFSFWRRTGQVRLNAPPRKELTGLVAFLFCLHSPWYTAATLCHPGLAWITLFQNSAWDTLEVQPTSSTHSILSYWCICDDDEMMLNTYTLMYSIPLTWSLSILFYFAIHNWANPVVSAVLAKYTLQYGVNYLFERLLYIFIVSFCTES